MPSPLGHSLGERETPGIAGRHAADDIPAEVEAQSARAEMPVGA
jgi:hypothetical protein